MITLFIDTTKMNETIVRLHTEDGEYTKQMISPDRKSQLTLPFIEEVCSEHQIQLQQITNIELATGPGSFTGIKVGAAIAGTLSLLLNIPINGLPPGTIPPLVYGETRWDV